LAERIAAAEPGPQLCAGIQTIRCRRDLHRRGGRLKGPSFVPSVDTTADLPANDSIRPVKNVDLH
jgi:hypothetical protein